MAHENFNGFTRSPSVRRFGRCDWRLEARTRIRKLPKASPKLPLVLLLCPKRSIQNIEGLSLCISLPYRSRSAAAATARRRQNS